MYNLRTPAEPEKERILTDEDKAWRASIYEGGKPGRVTIQDNPDAERALLHWLEEPDKPTHFRLQIVSVVTQSKTNTTAVDIVKHVYDYIRNATNNDERISYQILCGVKQRDNVSR